MQNTKKWSFFIAWLFGSIEGGNTKVNSENDLYIQYLKGNKSVDRFDYELPDNISEEIAWYYGAGKAFLLNYTGFNSCSYVYASSELSS